MGASDAATSTTIEQEGEPRRPRHRRGLTNGRAVVGALLVTAAAVVVFAGAVGRDDAPGSEVVVARTAIPIGHELGPDDLETVRAELPDRLLGHTYGAVDDAVGSIALAPLVPGELLQGSQVAPADDPTGRGPVFSFPIERDRAVDGQLRAGEHIDVLATYGSGSDAYTVVLARGATVDAISDGGGSGLGASGTVTLTVGVESEDAVLDLAHAAQVASLTVVRTSAADDGSAPTRARVESPDAGSDGTGS